MVFSTRRASRFPYFAANGHYITILFVERHIVKYTLDHRHRLDNDVRTGTGMGMSILKRFPELLVDRGNKDERTRRDK
ncbi:unnamed protein product [Laminaria digitata]